MKILFIGNSYTFFSDMPSVFEKLCRDNGIEADVYSVTKGGRKLYENIDVDDECTGKLNETINKNKFDWCIIQESSTYPISEFEKFEYGLTKLVEKVPSENFLLYETWGRKAGNKMLEELGLTNESMTFALYEAYKKMGEKLNVPVSHVGLNFYDIYCNHPEIDLYNPDLTHPSYEGTCLGALTHYHSIFGEFPENTASLKLGDEVISVFKNTVLASKC